MKTSKDLKKFCDEYNNTKSDYHFYENLIFYSLLDIFSNMNKEELINEIDEIKNISKKVLKKYKKLVKYINLFLIIFQLIF